MKIAARDVLATWKVLVVAVFAPAIYALYSGILFATLYARGKGLTHALSAAALSYIAQPFLHYLGVRSVENGLDVYRYVTV